VLLLHPELVQLNQRITLRWHIGPLGRRETFAYVRHRLSVASHGKARAVFTGRALSHIHRLSGGVPRLINMLAHRALLAAFAVERRRGAVRDVRKAHREVSAIPLPVQVRRSWAVPVTVAATLCAIALGLGMRELAVPPAPILPAVAADPPLAPLLANITVTEPPAPAAEPTATTLPPPPPPDHRLRAVDSATSMQAALEAVARAWRVDPPSAIERAAEDLPHFAERRQLEHLPLTGNVAMLRLLDVPAVLELRFPSVPDSRWASLVGLTPDRATLAIDGEPLEVELAFLERYWYGRAHVFARDFEGLGPGLLEERAARVTRRRRCWADGPHDGGETGVLDLPPAGGDGVPAPRYRARRQVGRLTRMVLYAAVGGHDRLTPPRRVELDPRRAAKIEATSGLPALPTGLGGRPGPRRPGHDRARRRGGRGRRRRRRTVPGARRLPKRRRGRRGDA
jgi:hypothetical protein